MRVRQNAEFVVPAVQISEMDNNGAQPQQPQQQHRQQQLQEFGGLWHEQQQQQQAVTSNGGAASAVHFAPFFYGFPATATATNNQTTNAMIGPPQHAALQSPRQQTKTAPGEEASSSAFQPTAGQQQQSAPPFPTMMCSFDMFADRSSAMLQQRNGFSGTAEHPLVTGNPSFGTNGAMVPAAAPPRFGAAFPHNFPGLLHSAGGGAQSSSAATAAAVAATVGFDLMHNFSTTSLTQHQSGTGGGFAVPTQIGAANLAQQQQQSTSASLMSAIYGNTNSAAAAHFQRTPNFLTPNLGSSRGHQSLQQALAQPPMGSAQAIPQPSSHSLFDLSNNIVAASNPSAAASVIAAAAISNASAQQQQVRESTSSTAHLKQSALSSFQVKAEAKMPKEPATIPLERSRSDGSSSEQQRGQQAAQMSCQVCHLAASNGLHFGARTCAACAAFFRRSISDQKRYICKRSQRCVIRPGEAQGYRKMCRNCRMKRCLEVGMLPENVQNKRNKREFYFVDALSSAIQQQQCTGVAQQHNASSRQQQQIQPLVAVKSEPDMMPRFGDVKLLLGSNPADSSLHHSFLAQPAVGNNTGNGATAMLSQSALLQMNRQHLGSGGNNNAPAQTPPHPSIAGATPIYSSIPTTPTSNATSQQQQPLMPTLPWGITLREI